MKEAEGKVSGSFWDPRLLISAPVILFNALRPAARAYLANGGWPDNPTSHTFRVALGTRDQQIVDVPGLWISMGRLGVVPNGCAGDSVAGYCVRV